MEGIHRIAAAVLAASLNLLWIGGAGADGEIRSGAGVHPGSVDWPQFRFDNDRNGYQRFENTLSKNNIASADLQGEAVLSQFVYYSSPVYPLPDAKTGSQLCDSREGSV
ncbi:MAG TPA: hypothetical protein VH020_14910 [Stellaceae bacterium]|nr:hypothetical protein [Stellaceae bacterium]